jgi:hypothetical protein
MENFSSRNCREEAIYATRKPGEGRAKEWSRCWQFRWSEKGGVGRRVYRKRVIGTIEQYSDAAEAQQLAARIIAKPSYPDSRPAPHMTVAELCEHFQHRELAQTDVWRSYSTKRSYIFYLHKWIIPRWKDYELADVRTVEVEAWLRSLALARSTCAKIRNLMCVVFNHACRHELFDRNPIRMVRQSAKRRKAPNVRTPILAEAVTRWRQTCSYGKPEDWVFASRQHRGRKPLWGQAILRKHVRPAAERIGAL